MAETRPFSSSSSGMRTRLVKGHACVCIISGSTCFPIAHLEVWSGKAHYYLHGIRIDLRVSTFLYAKGKALRSQSPPPPHARYNSTHTLERLPVTSYSSSSCICHYYLRWICPVFGQGIIVVAWGIYFVNALICTVFSLYLAGSLVPRLFLVEERAW